jgi:hypothetical protein
VLTGRKWGTWMNCCLNGERCSFICLQNNTGKRLYGFVPQGTPLMLQLFSGVHLIQMATHLKG